MKKNKILTVCCGYLKDNKKVPCHSVKINEEWQTIEGIIFIGTLSHGLCPDCVKKTFEEIETA